MGKQLNTEVKRDMRTAEEIKKADAEAKALAENILDILDWNSRYVKPKDRVTSIDGHYYRPSSTSPNNQ